MAYEKFFPETRVRRKLHFRIDCVGIYLLAYGMIDDPWSDQPNVKTEAVIAGISYQWPRWMAYLFGDTEAYREPDIFSRNYFSLYNYG